MDTPTRVFYAGIRRAEPVLDIHRVMGRLLHACLGLAGLAACGGEIQQVSWSVQFTCGEDRDATEEVIARIHAGGCAMQGNHVYETTLRRRGKGEIATPPGLEAGLYGFSALAVAKDGTLIAAGCSEQQLPSGGTVEVTLLSTTECSEFGNGDGTHNAQVGSDSRPNEADKEVAGIERCRFNPDCNGGLGAFCSSGAECETGFCCLEEKNCGGGMCTRQCNSDNDCPSDMGCEHGVCFLRCASHDECAQGMSCEHEFTVCEWD